MVLLRYTTAILKIQQKIEALQTKLTFEQYSNTLLMKYIASGQLTLWNKNIIVENNSLTLKGERLLTEESLQNIKLSNRSLCNNQKFLVYKCDNLYPCGGWADRQKGIVSTFLLALLTNRRYIIDMDKPCKLEHFLMPNVYNWSVCYDFVKNVTANHTISVNYIDPSKEMLAEIKSLNFFHNWSLSLVVSRFNVYAINEIRQHKLAKSRLKWLSNITNEEAIRLVLHTLFKPTVEVLKDVINFYHNQVRGKQLVCCHIRVGKNPSIPIDNVPRFGEPNITLLFDFLKTFEATGTNAIYIASDSESVKDLAKKSITSYININRTIVHVDRLGQFETLKLEACDGWNTVILEQFILSQCDTLVLTRSGLGTMAAYMRGVNENLFMFHPEIQKVIQTNLTDLNRSFQFY